eukprot:9951542-Lingulodinium_polyedra.AAC.1
MALTRRVARHRMRFLSKIMSEVSAWSPVLAGTPRRFCSNRPLKPGFTANTWICNDNLELGCIPS